VALPYLEGSEQITPRIRGTEAEHRRTLHDHGPGRKNAWQNVRRSGLSMMEQMGMGQQKRRFTRTDGSPNHGRRPSTRRVRPGWPRLESQIHEFSRRSKRKGQQRQCSDKDLVSSPLPSLPVRAFLGASAGTQEKKQEGKGEREKQHTRPHLRPLRGSRTRKQPDQLRRSPPTYAYDQRIRSWCLSRFKSKTANDVPQSR